MHSFAKSSIYLVPKVFICTAYWIVSSNLVLAAEWTIISTSLRRIFLSVSIIPKSVSKTSPVTIMHFLKLSGRSFFKTENNCNFCEFCTYWIHQLTTWLNMSVIRSLGLVFLFCLTSKYKVFTSVTLSSFSIKIFPKKPVAPEMKTVLFLNTSPIRSTSIIHLDKSIKTDVKWGFCICWV